MSGRVFSKSGQPKMGATLVLQMEGVPVPLEVVSKAWGAGGSADLVAVVLQDPKTGECETYDWPIRTLDGAVVAFDDRGWAL